MHPLGMKYLPTISEDIEGIFNIPSWSKVAMESVVPTSIDGVGSTDSLS